MENKNILNTSNNKEFMEAIPNTNKVRCLKCDKVILRTSWNNHIKSRGHLLEPKRLESVQHQYWRTQTNSKRERLVREIGIEEVRRLERERKRRNRESSGRSSKKVDETVTRKEPEQKEEKEEKYDNEGNPAPLPEPDAESEGLDPREEEDDENTRRKDLLSADRMVKSMSDKKERKLYTKLLLDIRSLKTKEKDLPLPEIKKRVIVLKDKYNFDLKNIANCQKLVDKLYEANPNSIIPGKEGKAIKKTTLMAYMERIDTLYKKINGSTDRHDCTDFKWLDDHTKVKKFIYDNFKDSPNNYFISIYSVLGRLGEKYFGVAKKYRDLMTQSNIKQGEKRGQNVLSERERSNWIDWTTLKNFSDKNWTDEARLLHALYTDIPPRRVLDYALLKLARKKSVPEARKMDKEFNYIVTNKNLNPIAIVLNRYKTVDKYGTYVIDLTGPNDLPYFNYTNIKKLAKTSIEHENIKHNELIFPNTKGKTYGKFFGKNWINFLFKGTGKKISVNLLRHSFVSYLLSRVNLSTMSDNSLKKISTALGHSPGMLLSYRKIDAKDAIRDFEKEDEEYSELD